MLSFIWITRIFDFENHKTSNLFKFMSFIYKLEYLECISWPLGCPLFTAIDWLGRSILGIKRITNSRPFNQLSNLKNRMFDMKPKCNFDKWQHVLRIIEWTMDRSHDFRIHVTWPLKYEPGKLVRRELVGLYNTHPMVMDLRIYD